MNFEEEIAKEKEYNKEHQKKRNHNKEEGPNISEDVIFSIFAVITGALMLCVLF